MKTTKKIKIIAALALFAGWGALADEAPPATNNMSVASQSTAAGSTSSSRFGAGIVVGQPIGANAKYWLNNTMALDGTFGWSLRDDDDVYLNADILWHNFDLIPTSSGRTAVYAGVGPSIEFRDEEDNRFGVRVPVGISYMLENKPVDVFVEVAPIVDVSPDVRGDFSVGIGVRYWF